MNKVDFPQVGDIRFFNNQKVIVKEVIKQFHFVKVSYIDSNMDFYTDITSLTIQPK